jgi:hypothetical protein
VVAHTGFEPVISALRGRCPRPLDECAKYDSCGVELSYFTLVLSEVWRNNVYAQLFSTALELCNTNIYSVISLF